MYVTEREKGGKRREMRPPPIDISGCAITDAKIEPAQRLVYVSGRHFVRLTSRPLSRGLITELWASKLITTFF